MYHLLFLFKTKKGIVWLNLISQHHSSHKLYKSEINEESWKCRRNTLHWRREIHERILGFIQESRYLSTSSSYTFFPVRSKSRQRENLLIVQIMKEMTPMQTVTLASLVECCQQTSLHPGVCPWQTSALLLNIGLMMTKISQPKSTE